MTKNALRLRAARRKAGKTLEQTARESGLSRKTLQRAEKSGTNSRHVIRVLAEVYGVHPIVLDYDQNEIQDFLQQAAKRMWE